MKEVVGQIVLAMGVALLVSIIVYFVVNNDLFDVIRGFYQHGVPRY